MTSSAAAGISTSADDLVVVRGDLPGTALSALGGSPSTETDFVAREVAVPTDGTTRRWAAGSSICPPGMSWRASDVTIELIAEPYVPGLPSVSIATAS